MSRISHLSPGLAVALVVLLAALLIASMPLTAVADGMPPLGV